MMTVTKSTLMSLALFYSAFWAHWVNAQEEFLCDATQASTQELPVLDRACPVGEGLWGKRQPQGKDSMFWIQCGIFKQPMPLEDAKVLYQQISTDVWMKPGTNQYRCLIGPYDNIRQARLELDKIRQLPDYHEAFIREVSKNRKLSSVSRPQKVSPPKKASAPKSRPAQPPAPQTVAPQTPMAQPKAPTPHPVAEPAKSPSAAITIPAAGNITIRKQTAIAGVNYAIPFLGREASQFYMEYELPWNRLSYDQAYATCQKIGMNLATERQWHQLLASQVMTREKWPVYLPYWGVNKKGMFTSGKVSQLKGTSLLNVLCVQ
ncbi:SPOR domain-containing protein [Vibrio mangrovi]|nr:SPOR domain-containing protein [Vibrio mangrovi]MDW6002278.1 SPOR domain-containing protein [Vibrio mangrovi]